MESPQSQQQLTTARNADSPKQPKARRSQFACETCRARKVKCDERPGGCFNCERLGLFCANIRNVSVDEHGDNRRNCTRNTVQELNENNTVSRFRRGRIYRSCVACRKSKIKCTGGRPTCIGCQRRGVNCSYEHVSQPLPAWARKVPSAARPFHSPISQAASLSNSPGSEIRHLRDSPAMQLDSSSSCPSSEPAPASTGDQPSLSWLTSPSLPGMDKVRLLVDHYFINIHPLRCFAFIHKPSFLQSLESQEFPTDRNALLHIICALGAQFYALELCETGLPLTAKFIRSAGSEWAKIAQRVILEDMDQISVQNLMAVLLVQDYMIRMGNFALAFMLSAVSARMSQALQINLEYSADIFCKEGGKAPSRTLKESRRRLMWSCYVTDSLVGSGVDQLTLINEDDLKIQLPCNERSFTQQAICITETLKDRKPLAFIPEEVRPSNPADNMGIIACFLRLIEIRRRVLRYIKHLDEAKVPWLRDSEFALLDAECKQWYDTLAPSLQFTPAAIYIRKETNQLGALCILHCAYHQTMCDLYRLGAPKLYKVRAAFDFPEEQREFLNHLQWNLFEQARRLAEIVGETQRHGTRSISDSWLPTITYDSCRIIVYYLTQLIEPSAENGAELTAQAIPLLQSNLNVLKKMQTLYAVAEPLHLAAKTMIEKFGLSQNSIRRKDIIPDDPYRPNPDDEQGPSAPGTPPQCTPEYVLNPLSLYRMARKSIPEKHTPENMLSVDPYIEPPQQQSLPIPPSQQSQDSFNSNLPASAPVSTPVENTMFDELQTLFTSDLGWAWHPLETAVGSGIGHDALFTSAPNLQSGDGQVASSMDFWTSNCQDFPF